MRKLLINWFVYWSQLQDDVKQIIFEKRCDRERFEKTNSSCRTWDEFKSLSRLKDSVLSTK